MLQLSDNPSSRKAASLIAAIPPNYREAMLVQAILNSESMLTIAANHQSPDPSVLQAYITASNPISTPAQPKNNNTEPLTKQTTNPIAVPPPPAPQNNKMKTNSKATKSLFRTFNMNQEV